MLTSLNNSHSTHNRAGQRPGQRFLGVNELSALVNTAHEAAAAGGKEPALAAAASVAAARSGVPVNAVRKSIESIGCIDEKLNAAYVQVPVHGRKLSRGPVAALGSAD